MGMRIRRVVSFVLSLAMAMAMIPTAALAEETDYEVVEVQEDALPEPGEQPEVEAQEEAPLEEESVPEEGSTPSQGVRSAEPPFDPNADRVQYNPELPQELLERSARQETEDEGTGDELVLTTQSVSALGYVPYDNAIWASESNGCIYFLTDVSSADQYGPALDAYRYDVTSGTSTRVGSISGDVFYYTDDQLYAYEDGTSYYNSETDTWETPRTIHVIDLASGSERSVTPETSAYASAIGVDQSGRVYLFGSDGDTQALRILDASGKLIATKRDVPSIYSFVGFDQTNGNFYFMGYYNWVYWGYDHAMASLKVGNFNGSSITTNDKPITIAYQSWFFTHYGCVEMLGDRYLADLSTFSGDVLSVLDSHAIGVNDVTQMETTISLIDNGVEVSTVALPAKAIKLAVQTHDSEYVDNVDVSSVGARVAYLASSDMVAVATDRSQLTLYSLSKKTKLGEVRASKPIYKVMATDGKLVMVEKGSGGSYEVERLDVTFPTKVQLQGPSSVAVGGSADYQVTMDGTVRVATHIASSDSSVLSVDDQGIAAAWKAGTVTLTGKTDTGLVATKQVTVTARPSTKRYADVIATNGEKYLNWNERDNSSYGSVVTSYLVESGAGFSRVQARENDVLVERWNASGKVLSTKRIKYVLPIFGGYYCGADGSHYLVFGNTNVKESDSKVVLCVVRYNSSWRELGRCSVRGINTYDPFDAGSLRMDEANGRLYIHTCHTMYASEDGVRHQANMTFAVQESNMRLVDSYTGVMNLSEGYVSHSFNQFVRTDGSYLYRVDHGDYWPRGIAFTKTPLSAKLSEPELTGILAEFENDSYYNYTGASVGGMELSDSHVLVAWNQDAVVNDSSTRNIYVSSVNKEGGTATTMKITNFSANGYTCFTPQLVKIDGRHFVVMWTEYSSSKESYRMGFARIDQAGQLVGKVVRKRIPASDCQPILLSDGSFGWFVSSDRVTKVYTVDPFALESATEDPFTQKSMCLDDISWGYMQPLANKKYTGKAYKPKPKVMWYGKTLRRGTDYTVSYKNNKYPGTASVIVTGKGEFKGKLIGTFKIAKLRNPFAVKAVNRTVKYAKVRKKAVTVKRPVKFTKKAKGTVTYKKVSGSKRFSVNKKTGKVKVKKGTKKGTYTIKIKVRDGGTKLYKAVNKTVKVTVVVE